METYETAASQEQIQKVDEIISLYKDQQGELISALHEIQKVIGYLPEWSQKKVSKGFKVPLSEVYSIVTFYSLFSQKPKGKYCIGICKGTACYVRGSEKILKKVEEILGIEAGDTTPDGKFSIEVVRCLGACGLGPVMTVNEHVFTRMKADRVREIINEIIRKDEGRDST